MSRHKEHPQARLRKMYPDGKPARPDLSGERKLILAAATLFVIAVLGLTAAGAAPYFKASAGEAPAAADCPPTVTKTGIVSFVDPFQPESEAISTTGDGSMIILTDEGFLVKTNPEGRTSLLGQIDSTTGLIVTVADRLPNFPNCDWKLTFGITLAPQQLKGAGTFIWGLIAEQDGD